MDKFWSISKRHWKIWRESYGLTLQNIMDMRARILDGRRLKPRVPTKVDTKNDPDDVPQYFQVSVSILEAKKLSWANMKSATSYVIVVLDKKRYRTSIRRNMLEPCYKESFLFELYASLQDIQRQCLWIAVMEPRCCGSPRLLGEANVDLAAVWAQPHHTVSHKWAQLTLSRDGVNGPVGFLKVDISIVYSGEVQVFSALSPATYEEKVEDNLLLPNGAEQQRANYQITVFGAYELPNGTLCHADRYGKPPSTFVRVSFCGLMAKTGIQCRDNSPLYSEQISMIEMFPNICQVVKFEVCSADGSANRVLASTNLKLAEISHGGENGFLPTFGPSLLHLYGPWSSGTLVTGENGPYHRGALLVSLKTIVPYYKQGLRTINVEPVTPLRPESQWSSDDFCVYCPIFGVSMLDRKICGKSCGVAITLGEIRPPRIAGCQEFLAFMQTIKQNKLHYTGTMDVYRSHSVYGHLEFENKYPVLQLATRMPDFRFRMYKNNMVHGIVTVLESELADVEGRLRTQNYGSPNDLMEQLNSIIDDAAAKILKFLDIVLYSGFSEDTIKYSTELDTKQLQLQKEEIEKIYNRLSRKLKVSSTMSLLPGAKLFGEGGVSTKKGVKILLAEAKSVAQDLKSIIFKTSNGWPDLVLWILSSGTRVAHAKISAADIMHSAIPEQRGRDCGHTKTFYLKPIKCPKHLSTVSSCNCIAGKIELLAWLGLFRQRGAFDSYLPEDINIKVKKTNLVITCTPLVVECRVNIYRAKLNCADISTNTMSPYVRVNFMNAVKESRVHPKSANPVWSEVIRLNQDVFSSSQRLADYPPMVLVEVYNRDATDTIDLIGRVEVEPVVDDRQEFAPQLQWLELKRGDEQTGRIQMSAQMIQVQEKELRTTYYSHTQESFVTGEKDSVSVEEHEPLPSSLIPTSSSYKVDLYWWGLRKISIIHKPCVVLEIEDLTIKSSVIADANRNCNFPNGKTSQVFEGNLSQSSCATLSVRLYDSSTFGRTMFLGDNVVKKPSKFMVTWLPKKEREESLYSSSIMSTEFVQVNRMVFVKKSQVSAYSEESSSLRNSRQSSKNSLPKSKLSLWKRMFSTKEAEEEELTLLPMFSKKKDVVKEIKKSSLIEQKDWWMRYLESQTEYMDEEDAVGDRFIIYDSELESQPGFSRFKDWCSTLKMYNGKKTGIPEKDEQLHCGYLKVGIAIYHWPPPGPTVAVSSYGVDLDKGYFDDHPENVPAKFLARVYVVKATGLVTKDFAGKSYPYVTLQCGRKMIGERHNYVPKTANPVFGKVYEFRCAFPEDYILKVSVLNYETTSSDELIGYTCIDLEDRVYTKHRASVGIASEYNLHGPSKWRDSQKPSDILEELCMKNHLPNPEYPDSSSVIVNGVEYKDCEFVKTGRSSDKKEGICLNILHKWHTLPICGYRLVPEHLETRTLYNPTKPGEEQGKIQLWVDMFPLDCNMFIPAPVDITPRHREEFELRMIIWEAKGVNIQKDSSDIYVKAWIGPSDEAQDTDIHYKSKDGDGTFNWRMVFHFQFQHTEKKGIRPEWSHVYQHSGLVMESTSNRASIRTGLSELSFHTYFDLVLNEKGPFTEIEEYFPPILIVQVQDSQSSTPEEFLGTLMLDLTSMPRGVKLARYCTPDVLERRKINLFVVRNVRGWWPLKMLDRKTGNYYTSGMIHLDLTLLPKEKAILMPVGLGRDSPFRLPNPKRSPAASKECIPKRYGLQKRTIWCLCLSTMVVTSIFLVYTYVDLPTYFLDMSLDRKYEGLQKSDEEESEHLY